MTGEFAIAVHALVYLNHKDRVLSSEELAENICTNPARVRKVMAKLHRHRLVETKEGVNGGYQMRKASEEITLRQICEAMETQLVKAAWRSGDMDAACLVSSGMAAVMDEIYGELDALCRERLETITIQTICRELLSGQETERRPAEGDEAGDREAAGRRDESRRQRGGQPKG